MKGTNNSLPTQELILLKTDNQWQLSVQSRTYDCNCYYTTKGHLHEHENFFFKKYMPPTKPSKSFTLIYLFQELIIAAWVLMLCKSPIFHNKLLIWIVHKKCVDITGTDIGKGNPIFLSRHPQRINILNAQASRGHVATIIFWANRSQSL